MTPTPAARPFRPSMKFIALVANRIQARVGGTAEPAEGDRAQQWQVERGDDQAADDGDAGGGESGRASLTVNGQSQMSSRKATAAMAVAARITPQEIGAGDAGEAGDGVEHGHAGEEGDDDADAAALGDRAGVDLARVGVVEHADAIIRRTTSAATAAARAAQNSRCFERARMVRGSGALGLSQAGDRGL